MFALFEFLFGGLLNIVGSLLLFVVVPVGILSILIRFYIRERR